MSGAAMPYGFRHDPMRFVEDDRGLQGALVRARVFRAPRPGDQELIQKQIDALLAKQRADGSFADTSKETGERLLELLELGLPHDRPEVTRAAEAALRQHRGGKDANEWFQQKGCMAVYPLHALCLLGKGEIPEVAFSLRWLAEHPEEYVGLDKGCPWTPSVFLKALWAGRKFHDVEPAVRKGLEWIRDGLNEAGCFRWKEPWGLLDCAAYIDHPVAREIVAKQVPMILRAQRPDGGWGDRSLLVFRALEAHGLLEPLRKLPPLPPDWRVIRSIPAPEGQLYTMAWDGQRLWVYDRKANEAVALSVQDGKEFRRLKLPVKDLYGIGSWDGALAVTQQKPKRLLQIDPETGVIRREISLEKMVHPMAVAQVGGKLWVSDGWLFPGAVIDPTRPEVPGLDASSEARLERHLAGPCPLGFAPTPDGVWHVDFWAPLLIKSGPNGQLLDWGERPFDGRCDGIAWDGENLWALDAKGKRLCVIEKAIAVAVRQAGAAQAAAGPAPALKHEGGRVWMEGMDRYRVIDPMFEGVRLVLAARGESYSPGYIQGISGSAFRIGGICPCAPTCNNAMSPEALIRLLGYEAESLRLPGKGDELKAQTREVVARVKQEIDAGRAAIVFHAFTNAEFDVVHGYDSEKRQFLGRGSYAGNDKPFAEADEMRMGTSGHICDPLGAILVGRKAREFDARKAEIDALQEAVRHARSQKNVDKLGGDKWVMLDGLACYDRWIRDFGKPDKKRDIGDAYCYGVYRSTHRAAAGFLREIAPKCPKGADHLKLAADRFAAEADALAKGEKFLWWDSPEGPDPKRNAEAAAILKLARDAYAAGIAEIEKALGAEGIASTAGAGEQAVSQDGYPQVLLDPAVKAFEELAGRHKGHVVTAGGEVYQQPYVYLTMHVVEMRVAGWRDADFDTVAAVSGASALFGYEPKSFMPKCAHLSVGPHQRIAEATGFGYEWVKFRDAEDAWRIIKETVRSGRVAKGWHYENCAFCGYQDAARAEDRKVYALCDGAETFSKWWTWKEFTDWVGMVAKWNQCELGRHTTRVPEKRPREVALRVMNDLVAWSERTPDHVRKQWPKATWGLAGMEAYAADCANVEKLKDWTMCHDVNPQWTLRNSTAVYLQGLGAGNVFPKEASDRIASSAKEYRAAYAAWLRAYGLLGHGATKEQRQEKSRREEGAGLIRQAVARERAAIAEIEKALAAEGGGAPAPARRAAD